jgi:hypothetical protein
LAGLTVFFVVDEGAIIEQWTPGRNDEAGKTAKLELQTRYG